MRLVFQIAAFLAALALGRLPAAEVSAEEHDYSGSDFEEEPVHFD